MADIGLDLLGMKQETLQRPGEPPQSVRVKSIRAEEMVLGAPQSPNRDPWLASPEWKRKDYGGSKTTPFINSARHFTSVP